MLPDFRLPYKATVIKQHGTGTNTGKMEQNRDTRSKATHSHLIYDKGDKSTQGRKDSFFKSCAGKTGQLHLK